MLEVCNPKPVSGVPDKNLISINSTRIHQYSYPDVDNIGAQRVQFMVLDCSMEHTSRPRPCNISHLTITNGDRYEGRSSLQF